MTIDDGRLRTRTLNRYLDHATLPARPRWRDRVFGSPVEDMLRGSGEIDVYAIAREQVRSPSGGPPSARAPVPASYFAWAGAVAAACSVVCSAASA